MLFVIKVETSLKRPLLISDGRFGLRCPVVLNVVLKIRIGSLSLEDILRFVINIPPFDEVVDTTCQIREAIPLRAFRSAARIMVMRGQSLLPINNASRVRTLRLEKTTIEPIK